MTRIILRHGTTSTTQPIQLRKALSAGTWNVRSLTGTGAACLLLEQLSRARINIMGLQEVRWHDSGEQLLGDYTVCWSEPPTGSIRENGVAIAMDRLASRALVSWRPINARLLTATFQHNLGQLQVIVAYAPTELAAADVKDRFYHDLDLTLSTLRPAQPLSSSGISMLYQAGRGISIEVQWDRMVTGHPTTTQSDC